MAKTKEEILSGNGIDLMITCDDFNTQLLHSMQEYADQETASLREENERLKEEKAHILEAMATGKDLHESIKWDGEPSENDKLREELEAAKKLNRELTDECNRNLKFIFEHDELRKEIERVKGLLEKTYKDAIYDAFRNQGITVFSCIKHAEENWERFKSEHNL